MDGLMVQPRAGSDPTRRLRGYFRGFGFEDPAMLDRLTDLIMAELDPATTADMALNRARQRVESWFAETLGPAAAPAGTIEAVGRAAFLLTGAARRWPRQFLGSEGPSDEMVAALRHAAPPVTPVPAVAMPEQSLAAAWSLNPARLLPRRAASKASQP